MKFFPFKNKYFFVSLFAIFIMLGMIVVIFSASLNGSKEKFPTDQPTQNPIVSKVVPDRSLGLKPGATQSFRIYFQNPINPNGLTISLAFFDLTQDDGSVAVPATAKLLDSKTVAINTTEPIKPMGKYTLSVKKADSDQAIFEETYLSGGLQPTRVQSNSSTLTQYLPYEAGNFKLSYLSSRNIYVFNFIYNPEATGTVSTQFEKAKQDALDFIKSKGINPSTVVIDFRKS